MSRFNEIYASSPNYGKVASIELNSVSQYHDEEIDLHPYEYIHTRFHPGGSLISVNMANDFKIDCENMDDSCLIEYESGNDIITKEFTCAASYSIMAGSTKSRMPLMTSTDLDISVPAYLELGTYENVQNYKYLRIGKVLMKPKNSGKILNLHYAHLYCHNFVQFNKFSN